MKVKIVCPQCSAKLKIGLVELILHTKVIDPNSGYLLKRTGKRHLMNNDTRIYLECSNVQCDFWADDEDEPLYKQYFYLFDLVNQNHIDMFSKDVQG
ncbi:hypothetical protein [Acinetobacter soli]|uniref:Uncharacterized protein n=1 Tax=Acinetobacter soli TaxID=487316 RepID=A0A1P8ENB2_9GAMM|nr:hypothetical protein [Acinetobacter soli]APV37687.1 hypothetical protein BEN76_16685 [Acinetobacter soli]